MAGGRRKHTRISADDLVDRGTEQPQDTVQAETREEAEESPPLLPWLEAIDEEDETSRTSRSSGLLGFGVAATVLVAGLGIYAFATRSPAPTDLAGPVDAALSEETLPGPSPALETPHIPVPTAKKHDAPAPPSEKRVEAPAPPAAPNPARPAAPVRAAAQARPDSYATSSIQLASYLSRRQAEAYWQDISGRHKLLAALDHRTVEGTVDGRTVYRLRASGDREVEICRRLQSQGVPCFRIGRD